jgi:CTP:molybdopterin cytidylyltransferase MocA
MTVAACILADSAGSALQDVEGTPNVRRLADLAWAGGAMPVVVLAPDPDGAVAAVLAGSPALVGAPAPDAAGPVALIARAIDLARAELDATDAALIWPARFGWVDAETVTSLIEAHGTHPAEVLRPAFHGAEGWPILLPVGHLDELRALPAELAPDGLVARLSERTQVRILDLGDPGTVLGLDTPRESLPPFEGPPEPPAVQRHEWGSPAAEGPDEPPPPPRTVG